MTDTAHVGIVGAGLMGAGIAGCYLDAGHPVSVVAHRNRGPVDALLARGAREAETPLDLVQDCDVLLTCLPNAATVQALADQIVPAFRAGQVWIDVTTSLPETSVAIAARLAERGAVFADAPVTGGPPQAAEGKLASIVGCEAGHFARIEALIRPYSSLIRRFGPPGRGHAAKLLNNLVSQGTMVLLADAFQSAARFGIDAHALYDVMMTGAARSGTLEKAVPPALEGRYDGSLFSIANAAKDLRYARDLVAGLDPARADVATALAARLTALADAGHGDDYVSTMLKPGADTPEQKEQTP